MRLTIFITDTVNLGFRNYWGSLRSLGKYRGGVYKQYNEKGWEATEQKGDREAGNGEREHLPTSVHAHVPTPQPTPRFKARTRVNLIKDGRVQPVREASRSTSPSEKGFLRGVSVIVSGNRGKGWWLRRRFLWQWQVISSSGSILHLFFFRLWCNLLSLIKPRHGGSPLLRIRHKRLSIHRFPSNVYFTD